MMAPNTQGVAQVQGGSQVANPLETDEVREAIRNLVQQNVVMAVDREKVYQYAVARRNDFYYRGMPWIAPTFGAGGEIVDYAPVSGNLSLKSTQGNQAGRDYDYVVNDFRGDIRKYVGVLGSKSPNAKGVPVWAGDDEGTRKARLVSDGCSYLDKVWDVEGANRYLVLSLAKNGTTFIYTPFESNAEKYGSVEEPVWGEEEVQLEPDSYECMQCGEMNEAPGVCQGCGGVVEPQDLREGEKVKVPKIIDYKKYPRGTVGLYVYSVFNVTTPFYVSSPGSGNLDRCPWLKLDVEDDAAAIVERHPNKGLEEMLRGRMSYNDQGGASSSDQLGQLARNQASSPIGLNTIKRTNLWTYSRVWLRPLMYNYLIQQGIVTQGGLDADWLVGELKKQFPLGLKVTLVNKKVVALEHELLDEVWTAVKPETSEFLYADPVFNDYVQGADLMLDGWNILFQARETSIPVLLFNPDFLDPKKIKKGFQVNEFVPWAKGAVGDPAMNFFRVPTTAPVKDDYEFVLKLRDVLREIVGLHPAVWGGEDPSPTAEQARRKLNQALMVLSTTWNEMRGGWSRARRNALRQLARYSNGNLVSSQGDPNSVKVMELKDLPTLLEGGWEVVCDQAIPMSWSQLKDFVSSLFQEAPEIATAMGAMEPENLSIVQNGIGLPGWEVPNLKEVEALKVFIGRLSQEQPIVGPDGAPQPSVAFNPVMFDAQLTTKAVKKWLLGEEGMALENTPGWQNVLAFGQAALASLQPPMPPQGPPPKGGEAPPEAQAPSNSLPTDTLPAGMPPLPPDQSLPSMPTPNIPPGPYDMVQ